MTVLLLLGRDELHLSFRGARDYSTSVGVVDAFGGLQSRGLEFCPDVYEVMAKKTHAAAAATGSRGVWEDAGLLYPSQAVLVLA